MPITDFTKWGEGWLAKTKRAFDSSPVTYARGGTSVAWRASSGRKEYPVADSDGGVIVVEAMDFIGLAGDLRLGGSPTLPEPGDVITDANGQQFEVTRIGGGQCYRWSDSIAKTLRIHTQRIGADVNDGELP